MFTRAASADDASSPNLPHIGLDDSTRALRSWLASARGRRSAGKLGKRRRSADFYSLASSPLAVAGEGEARANHRLARGIIRGLADRA